jgi:hypothetical protein
MRPTEPAWPDQNEAAPRLDVSVRTLARARTKRRLDANHYRRDGREWRYDVAAIESDPSLRCSTDGCDRVALGASGKCSACHYSRPRVCPGCGGPKAHHAELCRDCSAKSGKLVGVQADAVAAKRQTQDQAHERWQAEGLMTRTEAAGVLGTTYVPANLEPTRVEVVTGSTYKLYAEPRLVDFRKGWARGGDGRRRAWWQPTHVTSVLGGRGDLKAPSVRDAEQRARERRAMFADFLRIGRPPLPTSVRWKELHEGMFGDHYEVNAAALGEPPLKPLKRCLEVAVLDFMDHPEDWPDYQPAQLPADAARRVYRALKRQGVL